MLILVNSINSNVNIKNTNIKVSNDVICPICKKICKYEINDYQINYLIVNMDI